MKDADWSEGRSKYRLRVPPSLKENNGIDLKVKIKNSKGLKKLRRQSDQRNQSRQMGEEARLVKKK